MYHWGNSSDFQLACFEPYTNASPKEFRSSFGAHKLNYCLAGNNHNLLYSRLDNTLYSYGSNDVGQLGISHYNKVKGVVNLSKILGNKKASSIDVRSDLNTVIMEDGTAYIWPLCCD